jgi:tyrosyl-tRNA synthetase
MRLALEITKIYHGEKNALEAQDYFVKTIQKKEIPEDVKEIKLEKEKGIVDVLVMAGLADSKSDARRKIEQGGVSIGGEIIKDFKFIISERQNGQVVKVGKKDFRKIEIR